MAGWIILGVAVVLILLLIAPIRVKLKYDKELFTQVRYLFIRYQIAPKKEKKAKSKKKKKQQAKKDKGQSELLDQKSLAGIVTWVKTASDSVSEPVKRILSKGKITRLCFYMDVVGDNPADAAFEAGRLNAYVYSLYAPVYESFKKVCEPDILILPNYYAEEPDIFFEAHLHVSLGSAIAALVQLGIRLLTRLYEQKKDAEPEKAQANPVKS